MGFGFWGPSKGPARAQSDLANKVQDPRTPLVSINYHLIQSEFFPLYCDRYQEYQLIHASRPIRSGQ